MWQELTSTIPALKSSIPCKKKNKNKKPSKYPEAVKPYGVTYYTEIVHKNWRVHLAGASVL